MEWNPEDYARNSGGQLVWANELIARLNLAGDEAVLDVGCGDGKITAAFANSVPQGYVLGVDSSQAFIEYARAHYPGESYPNLRFEYMDARNLHAKRTFDLIFSNAVLHWVDDQRAFLAGCAGLLKPLGRLVLSFGGAGNAAEIVAVMDELICQPRWAAYFRGFIFPYNFCTAQQYRGWLAEAGFKPSRLELIEKDMVHAGRGGLAGWMRTTWFPYMQRVPEGLREDYLAECVDLYLARHPLDAQGRSHVKMVRLEVEAGFARRG